MGVGVGSFLGGVLSVATSDVPLEWGAGAQDGLLQELKNSILPFHFSQSQISPCPEIAPRELEGAGGAGQGEP